MAGNPGVRQRDEATDAICKTRATVRFPAFSPFGSPRGDSVATPRVIAVAIYRAAAHGHGCLVQAIWCEAHGYDSQAANLREEAAECAERAARLRARLRECGEVPAWA